MDIGGSGNEVERGENINSVQLTDPHFHEVICKKYYGLIRKVSTKSENCELMPNADLFLQCSPFYAEVLLTYISSYMKLYEIITRSL